VKRRRKKAKRNFGAGRTVNFHGAFSKKADAERKEAAVGGFIRKK